MPEFAPVLYHEGFDFAYFSRMTDPEVSITDYGEVVESWSGYALQRAGLILPAFIVPALDDKGRTNVACSAGLIRFWLRPYWSSASLPDGKGPGTYARLVELAAVDDKQSAVVFSLQVNPDGAALSLIGQSDTDPLVLLKASIEWQAGDWHLVALDYGPKGTALFLDGQLAAEGVGTLAITPNVAQLVVGSTLAGTEAAEAEFDEVYFFGRFDESSIFGRFFLRRWPAEVAVAAYYSFASGQAARGAISAEEDAAWREIVAKRKAEREAAGEGGDAQLMRLVGGTSECVTNVPVYLTNVACTFVTDQGWTVTFDIQGGTNGLLYDVFRATNLLGNSLTNSEWTWLESGPTCSTYQYTNQPPQAFYVLTTPGADQDADGLYDGWEWKYFSTLAQGASDDFDQDGVSNYNEYLGGTDPNTVEFDVQFNNFYVSADTATGTVVVAKGVPAQLTVLVDNTNLAAASWIPFDPTVLVDLGTTDARHEVWIGLKGRPDTSQATWEVWHLTRDTCPPWIVITNAVTTVQPVLQAQGYSPEALLSLSCDLTNSSGLATNQLALVLDQYYETNIADFTTNYIQCFDLALTNGANTITIRAADVAGNVMVTNFTFTLDYSGDTDPPSLQLYSPQDGEYVCGSNFTWRGWVDDPTAQLTVQTVDTNGVTNSVSALVERNGNFWVEDLPLSDGTNVFTLMATDAAGNLSETNISVIKSDLELTLDPVPEESLWEMTVTVTGTINSSDYTVWVNGVQATLNGDGTWTAQEVPLPPGGTAVIQARAIPNSDNGGNGSGGGSGGGDASLANPGNPGSAQARNREAAPDKADMIYVESDTQGSSYSSDYYAQAFDGSDWEHEVASRQYNHHWAADVGGGGSSDNQSTSTTPSGSVSGQCGLQFTWPRTFSPDAFGTQTITGDCGPDVDNTAPRPPIGPEHCDVSDPKYSTSMYYEPVSGQWWTSSGEESYRRTADTMLKLFTGGKAGPPRKNLFVIRAWVSPITDKRAKPPYEINGPHGPEHPYGLNKIQDSRVVVGELGPLGSDGVLVKALPNGITKDVTPRVVNMRFYWFKVPYTKCIFKNLCYAPVPVNQARTTIAVGEWVNFSFTPAATALPMTWKTTAGSVSSTNGWSTTLTAPSNAVDSLTVTASVRGEDCSLDFKVREPSGIKATIRGQAEFFSAPYPRVAAGMFLDVFLQPTTVSFYRVEMMEPGANATGVDGYFENNAFSHNSGNGANEWHPVDYNNKVLSPPDNLFDHAALSLPSSALGQSGSLTWPIDAIWRVSAGDTTTDALNGWTPQVFTLSSGTVTIQKLGRTVVRQPNEPRGTAQ